MTDLKIEVEGLRNVELMLERHEGILIYLVKTLTKISYPDISDEQMETLIDKARYGDL